jgi:pseudouridine-5'-phosphate glycosidase
MEIAEEVRAALLASRPVVALETSVVAQGLPPPANLDVARACVAAIREAGAVPAAIAVIEGRLIVGATDAQLERLADPRRKPAKAAARDLGALIAGKRDAGTTVSATCAIAEVAGIRFFATGGIGGVHRRLDPLEPADVSSDLGEIARRKVCVVCAGPKVILDVSATFELLETLGVPVWSLGRRELPAFYTSESGVLADTVLDGPATVAAALHAHWGDLGSSSGVVVAAHPPVSLRREEVEAALGPALREAAAGKVPGKEVTPFLLRALSRATQGRTQEANVALLVRNATLAAEIAVLYHRSVPLRPQRV